MIPGTETLFRLAPRVLIGIAIATAIVLFVPEDVAVTLAVDSFRVEYRGLLGRSFILSVTLFCCWAVETFILSKKRKADAAALRAERAEEERKKRQEGEEKARKKLEASQQQLHELTAEEKEFVAPYVFKDVTSQHDALESGVVKSLLHKCVLMPPDGVGNIFDWPFQIQPWALKYLKEHPEILKGFEASDPRRGRDVW